MPGVGIAQGEGNRDTPILRGNSSTSDFFVDGVRDDVQYFRDVYNVDRVEALKGPNAMIFGRGGVGGVINRVTRQADWGQSREASLQFGSWDNKRFTADVGRGLNETVAVRATGALRELRLLPRRRRRRALRLQSDRGVPRSAPTRRCAPSYEYFHDERDRRPRHLVVQRPPGRDRPRHVLRRPDAEPDRCHGQPVLVGCSSTGSARASRCATALSYGDYDKFYQNVFPGCGQRRGHDRRDLGLQQRDRRARTCSTRPT